MNLFYSPGINSETIYLTLPEEESTHAIRVLRMKKGAFIFLTDGKEMFYKGEIISDNPKKCSAQIIRSIPDSAKRIFHLTIAIAPTKNIDRFEWFLEKATEIGCDEIIPISCKHSERTVIKTERLNKVIVSAMKQCIKSQLPKLHELIDFKKFIASPLRRSHCPNGLLRRAPLSERTSLEESPFGPTPLLKERGERVRQQKFIGHIPELSDLEFPPTYHEGELLSKSLLRTSNSILIAIGPEGGFSDEEVSLAVQSGFTAIRLGNSRLRVETAGVVACSIANSRH